MQKQIKEATRRKKEKCPNCNKFRANLKSVHLKNCIAKTQTPEKELQPGIDNMSNQKFITVYKRYLLNLRTGITPKTANNYQVYIKRIIKLEEGWNKDFKATNWFAHHNSTKFIALREPNTYIPEHYGTSSVQNFLAAYRILHTWIRKGILDATDTPLAKHDRLAESINLMQKKAKRGKYRRAKKNVEPLIPTETQKQDEGPLDPVLVQKILDSYLTSEVM